MSLFLESQDSLRMKCCHALSALAVQLLAIVLTSFGILYILLSFALGSLASITCVALWWKSHGPVESSQQGAAVVCR